MGFAGARVASRGQCYRCVIGLSAFERWWDGPQHFGAGSHDVETDFPAGLLTGDARVSAPRLVDLWKGTRCLVEAAQSCFRFSYNRDNSRYHWSDLDAVLREYHTGINAKNGIAWYTVLCGT